MAKIESKICRNILMHSYSGQYFSRLNSFFNASRSFGIFVSQFRSLRSVGSCVSCVEHKKVRTEKESRSGINILIVALSCGVAS